MRERWRLREKEVRESGEKDGGRQREAVTER